MQDRLLMIFLSMQATEMCEQLAPYYNGLAKETPKLFLSMNKVYFCTRLTIAGLKMDAISSCFDGHLIFGLDGPVTITFNLGDRGPTIWPRLPTSTLTPL